MCLGLRQHPRAPLTELARYAETLMKIADRSVRTSESSKYKSIRSAVGPNRSHAHAAMTSSDAKQKSAVEAAPKSWDRSYDNKHQSSPLSSSDKISYCRICLAKTQSLLQ